MKLRMMVSHTGASQVSMGGEYRRTRIGALLLSTAMIPVLAGCASPLDIPTESTDNGQLRNLADAWSEASTRTSRAFSPVSPDVTSFNEDTDVSEYLAVAAMNNPGLESAFARWRSALERLPQVRALPDPSFGYGYYIEQVETRVGPQEHRFRVAQTFPWFGELDLREDVAGKEAETAYERYQGVKLALFFQVQDAFFERYYLARAIGLTEENIGLLTQIERIARVRYQVAQADHPDVIRLQVEVEKLQDRLQSLEDGRQPLTARLNAVLNLETSTELPWPARLLEISLNATDQSLLSELRQRNPALLALDRTTERERLASELARKDYYPDVTVGLDYIVTGEADMRNTSGSGKDPIVASVSINLPLWREKYDAGVREALSRRFAVAKQREDAENTLIAEAQSVLYQYRDADRQVVLFRDALLPKATQSMQATLTAYQAGTGSFTDLLDAQRLLLEFQLAFERARATRLQALAKLDMLVGTEVPRTVGSVQNAPEVETP